jgi:hypothetical protein
VYVKKLHGENVKKGKSKRDLADQVIADIQDFKKKTASPGDGLVRIDRGTEALTHSTIEKFEKGLDEPPRHPALDGYVCGDQARHPLRQRGAEPPRIFPASHRAGQEDERRSRQGLGDGPR